MKIDPAFAFEILGGARKRGADLAEVYLRSSKKLSVEVKDRQLDAVESSVDFGYSLRIIRDKRLGFSFSNDPSDAAGVIDRAIESSRWTEQDEHLDLPGPAEHQILDIFDDPIDSLGQEEVFEKAVGVEEAALGFDARVKKVRKAVVSCSSGSEIIVNSKGLEKACSLTSCAAQITVVAKEREDSRMGWDFDGSRFLKNIDFRAVGKKAAERAVSLLGSRKMQSIRADVILDNSVAVDFLGVFAELLSSEAVQKGKSLLAGRLGEKIVSGSIDIVDNGLLEQRIGSRPFDGEGVPTFGKSLVEEGVLRGYMYNVYTSGKDGVKSTGNAVRGVSSVPSVGPAVLFISSSSSKVKRTDMLACTESCLYITDVMGMHTANPVSGEFSVGVSGMWLEKGYVKYPVSEAVISGNILDFFGNVGAVGDDIRFFGNMGSPSLLIEAVDISA